MALVAFCGDSCFLPCSSPVVSGMNTYIPRITQIQLPWAKGLMVVAYSVPSVVEWSSVMKGGGKVGRGERW